MTRHAETLIRNAINRHMKKREQQNETKSLDKKAKGGYLNMFALITYLRQGTSHMFLFDSMLRRYWKGRDFDKVIQKLCDLGFAHDSVLLKRFRGYEKAWYFLQTKTGAKHARKLDHSLSLSKGPPMIRRLVKMAGNQGHEGAICRICYQLPEDPHVSPVGV